VHARFNAQVVDGLRAGAREALLEAGASPGGLEEIEAPGAFELPLVCLAAARSGRFDAVVALGAVIRGGTDHYEHVARAAAEGLLRVSLDSGVPVAFGVLTTADEAQALERAAPGEGNKGGEAARAALATVNALRGLAVRARERRRPALPSGRAGRRPRRPKAR
jgi:6,7-dimethyl-8-ribityllumazine synthase